MSLVNLEHRVSKIISIFICKYALTSDKSTHMEFLTIQTLAQFYRVRDLNLTSIGTAEGKRGPRGVPEGAEGVRAPRRRTLGHLSEKN